MVDRRQEGEPDARKWNPDDAKLALPDRRLLGFVIDAVILIVLSMPGVVLILGGDGLFADGVTVELSLVLEGISGLYYVVFTGLRGQTPGKMIIRMKVVDYDRGGLPSWSQAFIRWAIPAAVGAIPVFGLLIFLVYAWLLWDRRNQGLHDKAARTLVIDVRPAV